MKLTEPQLRVLWQIERGLTIPTINFRTGDKLRRLGLVERETKYIAKRVYADANGEHVEFDCPLDDLVVWHEWWITPAGRTSLSLPPAAKKENGDG